jgi:capsid assembly protease
MTTEKNPSKPHSVRYAPPFGAIAAIEPSALNVEIMIGPEPPKPAYAVAGGKAVALEISGPLCYTSPLLDTYAGIRTRFDAALQGTHEAVILKLNSPGGDVAGAFDLSRYMRAAAAAAGKRLIAFTESQACSAAYALACAAERIVCSDTAVLGSVGVITCLENTSAAERAVGLSYAVIASGERKGDGNPHVPLTDEARAAIAVGVNAMAGVFFSHVAECRGGLDAQPLQGSTRVGAAAVTAGLADEVASWDALCAQLAAGAEAHSTGAIQAKSPSASGTNSMPDDDKDKPKEDAVRASLVTASESDDPEKASRAKRALAAYDEEEKKASASAAAADDKDPPKDEDKEKAAAAAATTAQASSLAATVNAMSAELASLRAREQEREKAAQAQARKALFDAHPGLTPEAIKALDSVPLASLPAVLASIPRPLGVPTLARTPLTGDTQATADRSGPEVAQALDTAFGFTKHNTGVVTQGVVQSFGAPLPKGSK